MKNITMKNWLQSLIGALIMFWVLLPISQADDETLLKTPRQIYCPLICESPVIDGKLEDPCWRNAEIFDLFMVAGQTVLADDQTSGKMFYDGTNLYLGVKCNSSGAFSVLSPCRERDGNDIRQDEVVEIFILPAKAGNDYYHFAVNPAGTIYDSHVNQGGHDAKWNSHLQAAACIDTNSWSVELCLPLADIAPVPAKGAEWRFNVCRESFAPLQELSAWTYLSAANFHTPQSFGLLYFRPPDDNYRKGGEAFKKSFVKQSLKKIIDSAAGISPPYFSNIVSTISDRHPRLFLNPAMTAEIKTNMSAQQRQYLSQLQKQVESYPANPETNSAAVMEDTWLKLDWGKPAANAALAYALTGEKKYLEKAKVLLKAAIANYNQRYAGKKAVNWYAFSRISALAAYDWIYADLTVQERADIGAPLLAHIQQTQGKRPCAEEGPSGPEAGFYGCSVLAWYAGLAFLGNGLDDAGAEQLIKKGYKDHLNMLRKRAAAAGDDGGSMTATIGYAAGDYYYAEFNFFYAWRAAFGNNFAAYFPTLAYFPNWLLWNVLISSPEKGRDGGILEFGTGDAWHLNNNFGLPVNYLAEYPAFYGQSSEEMRAVAKCLASMKNPVNSFGYLDNYSNPVIPLLPGFASESNKPPNPDALLERLPHARHFPILGELFMRSGWDDYAACALFIAGGKDGGHKHCDENNFIIYYNGFLAMDTGTRGASGGYDVENLMMKHELNYYHRSVAHNCVLIRMEGEKFDSWVPVPSEANNGGMNSPTGACVLAFETTDHYTYIASDATPAYHTNKCDLALRQFVFVYPDYFVVFDRVVSKKANQKKTWLLHTQNEPKLTGDIFEAEHWCGKLFCRTFLPTPCAAEKIGGPGKEFWSDDRNWPLPKERQAQMKSSLMGQWRMEISPAGDGAKAEFLHLIQVGDKGLLKTMTPSKLIEAGNKVGVKFQAGRNTVSILFNRDGPAGGQVRIKSGWFTTILDRPLTDKVQPQSGLALGAGRGVVPMPTWVSIKQGDRDLVQNGTMTNVAPIRLVMRLPEGELKRDHFYVSIDGDDAGETAAIDISAQGQQADLLIELGRRALKDNVVSVSNGAHVAAMHARLLSVFYRNPESGAALGFLQTFPGPGIKAAENAVYLSDLKEDSYLALKGSYKWFNKDANYAGQPIVVGANRYPKGLMLAPPDNADKTAYVEYTVPSECRGKIFKAVIGLDQSAGNNGSVAFRVKLADSAGEWQNVYESPELAGGGDVLAISVPLNGKTRLRLESCGGQRINSDHAVWADARLE